MLTLPKNLMVAVCLLCSTAAADQLAAFARAAGDQKDKPSYVFVGGEYDSGEDSFGAVVGGATRIRGPVWALARGAVGDYGSVEADVGLIFNFPDQRLDIGFVAGPGVNWRNVDDDASPVSYIIGTSGFFVGWRPDKLGIYCGGKYKFDWSRDKGYFQDGWVIGTWLALGVG